MPAIDISVEVSDDKVRPSKPKSLLNLIKPLEIIIFFIVCFYILLDQGIFLPTEILVNFFQFHLHLKSLGGQKSLTKLKQ